MVRSRVFQKPRWYQCYGGHTLIPNFQTESTENTGRSTINTYQLYLQWTMQSTCTFVTSNRDVLSPFRIPSSSRWMQSHKKNMHAMQLRFPLGLSPSLPPSQLSVLPRTTNPPRAVSLPLTDGLLTPINSDAKDVYRM